MPMGKAEIVVQVRFTWMSDLLLWIASKSPWSGLSDAAYLMGLRCILVKMGKRSWEWALGT